MFVERKHPQAPSVEPISKVEANCLNSFPPSEPSSFTRFISSLAATVSAVTITSPIDVLKTRLQVQKDKSMNNHLYSEIRHSFMKITREEGLKGLFKGYKATLMTTPLFHSIYFPVYERLRLELSNELNAPKSDFKVVCIASACAGIL